MTFKIIGKWLRPPAPEPIERPNFAAPRPPRSRSVLSFISSLSGHLLLIWLVGSTLQQVSARRSMVVVYPLRAIRLPETLIAPAPRIPVPQVKGAGSPGPSVTSASSAPAPAPAPGSAGGAEMPAEERILRQFQMPKTPAKQRAKQILIQPDLPPDLKLNAKIAVPELFLLQLPSLPKPKPVVNAERRVEEPVRRRETPPVTPQLVRRNREVEIANVRHAAVAVQTVPVVPLPNTNTTPIRLLDGIVGTRLPDNVGPPMPTPESINVVSIPEVAIPQARLVVLPPGNQGAPPSSSSDGSSGGGGGSGNGAATEASAAGPGAGASPGSGDAHALAGTTGSGSGVNSNGGNPKPPGNGAGRGIGDSGNGSVQAVAASGAGGGAGAGEPSAALPPVPAGATRIARPPDGKYSVVVLGSTNLEAYPEAAGALSGRLVYTVYIRAGTRKEWILQYCLPKAAEQATKLRGSAVPIDAPYPFLIYRPHLKLPNDPDYLLVHGFINAGGRFERLTTLGEMDAADKEMLVGALQHWEFRPASRDGVPAAVEILLIIPRESA